ncbi:uncharacterized protein LOC103671150 [Ursus maritimus]|uniref:Uncharacterized protein LOC103671150 n=1 Tax=Ursus maritimus TaxID=29073 RepID=A0A384CSY3_URSMA|nr:uncharacterized protein LOC103671150 [Ursus maritimus]
MLPLRPRDRAGPQRLAPEDPRPGRSTQWISFPESLTTPAPQSSHSQNVSAQRPVRGCDSEPSPSYRSRVSERFKDLPYCAPHLQPPSNGCALQNRRSSSHTEERWQGTSNKSPALSTTPGLRLIQQRRPLGSKSRRATACHRTLLTTPQQSLPMNSMIEGFRAVQKPLYQASPEDGIREAQGQGPSEEHPSPRPRQKLSLHRAH